MAELVDKLPNVGTTIFSVMSQLSVEHNALNLGQGFPSFPVDPELIENVVQAMRDGHNQYAPMPGVPELRKRIAEKIFRYQGVEYNPQSEITITAGASQALFTAVGTLIEKGDEVILFGPAYDCYAPAIELNGGVVKWVELRYPDFSWEKEQLTGLISNRTKLIIINNPHNPSGKVWQKSELDSIAEIVQKYNLFLISDEVYEHIVFDGIEHISMARYSEIRNRLMLTFSFGKSLHATGWKLGYAIGPEKWMTVFRKQHQFNVFTCNSSFQVGIAKYMEDVSFFDSISPMYEAKRDLFLSSLNNVHIDFLRTAGTYFQLLKFNVQSDLSDVELAQSWVVNHGITLIPISVFYNEIKNERVFRACFAKTDEEIQKASFLLNSFSF